MTADFYKKRRVTVKKQPTFTDLHLHGGNCFTPRCERPVGADTPHGWLCPACQKYPAPLTEEQFQRLMDAYKASKASPINAEEIVGRL